MTDDIMTGKGADYYKASLTMPTEVERLKARIAALEAALTSQPTREELDTAEKYCGLHTFKYAFSIVMKMRRAAMGVKDD